MAMKARPSAAASSLAKPPLQDARAHASRVRDLYVDARKRMMRLIGRQGASCHDAEDAMHDGVVELLSAANVEEIRDLPGFLYRLTWCADKDRHRQRRRLAKACEALREHDAPAVDRSMINYAVMQALEGLPEDQRTALTLKRSGLTYVEVAARMGLTVHQVRSLVAKALVHCESYLSDSAGEQP